MTLLDRTKKSYAWLIAGSSMLQSPLLLVLRLYWGWNFFQTGLGKLTHLDKTTEYFMSLGIPLAKLNVLLAGSAECIGGALLLLGLGARLATLPLIGTMAVAYFTAEREALNAIFSEPEKFISADPFLYLLVCLIVLAFGPGAFSIDWVIAKKLNCKKCQRTD